MREYCDQTGRGDLPEIVLGGVKAPGEVLSTQHLIDRIGRYRDLGVTTAAVSVKGRTRAEWCDDAARIGEDVIARFTGGTPR
jgi:hypothetical protein